MTASPNLSFRMKEDIDEVYTFPIKYDNLGFNRENSTVLVNYHEDSTATVIAKHPPGRSGYHENYPDVEDDPARQAQRELAHDLVKYAEDLLAEYDPKTSHWTANSGNRSLRDIYVEVDENEVDEVIIKMWGLLNEFKQRYIDYLVKHKPDKLSSPSNSLENKVTEIKLRQNQSSDH